MRGNLLVVEDNLTNQSLVRGLLTAVGYDVTVVGNGVEAIAVHGQAVYEAILMDCHMPALDGFEATRIIREREKRMGLKRVPIIALTGDVRDVAREACLDAGIDDFLHKPCRRADIDEVPSRWIPPHRAGQA
jgi:two-component system, sensor histidine kinase and response regulator